MAFRLLDQLDDLLRVVQLGIVTEGLPHDELLFLHVDRVPLLVGSPRLRVATRLIVVVLEVVDELDLVR